RPRTRPRERQQGSPRSVLLLRAAMRVRVFFFQAEDGIRDGHVTGVQTCALPILSVKTSSQFYSDDEEDPPDSDGVSTDSLNHDHSPPAQAQMGQAPATPVHVDSSDRYLNFSVRSEERRVGKECRSRWGELHEK